MDVGTYGRCESCNHRIPLERLEILPMAGSCMRCARARELDAHYGCDELGPILSGGIFASVDHDRSRSGRDRIAIIAAATLIWARMTNAGG